MNEDTKTCPFCAETIKAAAIVCRYCNHDFPAASRPIPVVAHALDQIGITKTNNLEPASQSVNLEAKAIAGNITNTIVIITAVFALWV